MSLLLAQSGHPDALNQCLLLGVKRTLGERTPMSAFDPKRTLQTLGPEHFQRACSAECLLLAQSGHVAAEFQCLLLGVKRTLVGDAAMSAFDPKRTSTIQICRDAHCNSQRGRLPLRVGYP